MVQGCPRICGCRMRETRWCTCYGCHATIMQMLNVSNVRNQEFQSLKSSTCHNARCASAARKLRTRSTRKHGFRTPQTHPESRRLMTLSRAFQRMRNSPGQQRAWKMPGSNAGFKTYVGFKGFGIWGLGLGFRSRGPRGFALTAFESSPRRHAHSKAYGESERIPPCHSALTDLASSYLCTSQALCS